MTVAAGPFIGYGADLQDSATNGSGYATVGSIIDIDTPDVAVGEDDASYVQMAAPWKQKIPKLIDPGTLKLTLIWKESTFAHIFGLLRTNPYYFKVVFPDTGGTAGSSLTFQGWYSKAPVKLHLEDMVVAEVEITVTGQITLVAGS